MFSINKIIIGTFSGIAVAFWLASQLASVAQENKPGALFFPDNPQIVATGKVLYAENCASCHGKDLEGEADWRTPGEDGKLRAPPHNKRGHTWHHHDKLLFGLTRFGAKKLLKMDDYQTNMPVYDGVLSNEDIISVLSYIKSTWPENIRERHDAMNAQYAAEN